MDFVPVLQERQQFLLEIAVGALADLCLLEVESFEYYNKLQLFLLDFDIIEESPAFLEVGLNLIVVFPCPFL